MTIYDNAHETGRVRVWDLGVRLFHWSLVAMVVGAYVTEDLRNVHKILGYIVIGLIAFRLIWGLIGTRHARFSDFVTGPGRVRFNHDRGTDWRSRSDCAAQAIPHCRKAQRSYRISLNRNGASAITIVMRMICMIDT